MQTLKFIGSGSAFNTKLGNNSAYYKENNTMLLIDCGSNIFHRIKENNLLEGVDKINVLITHCHADHVGSLADLILYTYYSHGEFAKAKVKVISAFDTYVDELLQLNGCTEGVHYEKQLLGGTELLKVEGMNIKYSFIKTIHVNEIPSYAIGLQINDTKILYSSDANIKWYTDVLDFEKDIVELDELYIDTCKADYNGNVHLSLRELTELTPVEYRNKVFCMHLDEGFIREEAEKLGFNVVNNEF